ncbi:MAG: hypothetical protein V1874_03580 [Spirochaetota bacterium]
MKKIFVLFVFALLISACNKSSSDSSDTSFRMKPNTLTKFDSPVPGTEMNYSTTLGSGNYAIIYNGTINNENYVGISLSNNPDPEGTESFNLKIYFQSSTIPSSFALTTTNCSITYKTGSNTYTVLSGGPLTLNFASAPATNTTYTIYTITSSGSISVGGNALSSLNINAVKAN